MNYAEMSLIELKQLAKERRYIKRYYVKSKEELVAILSLPAPPREMLLEKMTIKELREEAKQRGLKGWCLGYAPRRPHGTTLSSQSPGEDCREQE
jgi:hypothetical protein